MSIETEGHDPNYRSACEIANRSIARALVNFQIRTPDATRLQQILSLIAMSAYLTGRIDGLAIANRITRQPERTNDRDPGADRSTTPRLK